MSSSSRVFTITSDAAVSKRCCLWLSVVSFERRGHPKLQFDMCVRTDDDRRQRQMIEAQLITTRQYVGSRTGSLDISSFSLVHTARRLPSVNVAEPASRIAIIATSRHQPSHDSSSNNNNTPSLATRSGSSTNNNSIYTRTRIIKAADGEVEQPHTRTTTRLTTTRSRTRTHTRHTA